MHAMASLFNLSKRFSLSSTSFHSWKSKETEVEREETEANSIISLAEGMSIMMDGFKKLVRIINGAEEKFRSEEYMHLYTTIYNLCVQRTPNDHCDVLYNTYLSMISNYIILRVVPSLEKSHGVYLLVDLVKMWNDHLLMIRWLARFFQCLDRYHIIRRRVPCLHDSGLNFFGTLVCDAFHVRAKEAFIALINREREGELIARSLLKKITVLFLSVNPGNMKYYEDRLEVPILKDTAAYYARKASKHILADTCVDYMLMAEQCLQLEEDRATSFLHPGSVPKFMEKVQNELLSKKQSQLLGKEHSGLMAMLRNRKVEDLKRMYKLYHKIDEGLIPIAAMFKQHIVDEGQSFIKHAADSTCNQQEENKSSASSHDLVFIKNVIALHDEHISIIKQCFSNNGLLHKALKDAFEIFCNKVIAGTTTSEILASFADSILKKGGGSERLSDEDVEETLDKIAQLLEHIHEKDLFAEFYRKKLSRRLLFDRSASDDHERYILSKLKQNNGGQFTSMMEGMLTDLVLAREKQADFKKYVATCPGLDLGLDLSVSVLTTGFWPTYRSSSINLPSEMAACVEAFKSYYLKEDRHRKLSWVTSLGTCTMIGKFDAKPIELVVTTHQAATLMLFNSSDKLSRNEIVEQLNLPDEEVIRLLHSLSCTKYKILLKKPQTKIISKSDRFQFNSKFTDKMRRIKIPHPPIDEKKRVMEDVTKDRRYQVDAAVVRIMKSRKAMGYQELVGECIKQLSHSFKPDVKLLKKRIEDLINREYLKRDMHDANMIKYVA